MDLLAEPREPIAPGVAGPRAHPRCDRQGRLFSSREADVPTHRAGRSHYLGPRAIDGPIPDLTALSGSEPATESRTPTRPTEIQSSGGGRRSPVPLDLRCHARTSPT